MQAAANEASNFQIMLNTTFNFTMKRKEMTDIPNLSTGEEYHSALVLLAYIA